MFRFGRSYSQTPTSLPFHFTSLHLPLPFYLPNLILAYIHNILTD